MRQDKLTERQQEVLDYVLYHLERHGFWPSVRDIQRHFGFKSTNAVAGHLRALEEKKALSRNRGRARALTIGPNFSDQDAPFDGDEPEAALFDIVEIPVYGNISAGYPNGIDPGDAVDRIQVDTASVGLRSGRDAFALKVRGDSMTGAGIFDGDTVVLDRRTPRHEDIVAALIDGETTLKRFVKPRGGTPYLKAENPDFPELYPISELIIQGVAKAVVRKL